MSYLEKYKKSHSLLELHQAFLLEVGLTEIRVNHVPLPQPAM